MIDGKSVIGIVPARAGSKGLPRKNIAPLCGKPLIAWSIEAGLRSRYIDLVIVSTDSKKIAGIAVTAAVVRLYSKEFRGSLSKVRSPYGEGGASAAIVAKVKAVSLSPLHKKHLYKVVHISAQ